MADKILYTGVDGNSYVELKGKAQSALSTTGASFTWVSSVSSGVKAQATQIQEIVGAIDTAYDAINLGCSSKYSTRNTAQYGYTNSNTSVCTSNLSSVNSSADPSNKSSNLSALYSTKNTTYYTIKNSGVYTTIGTA